MKLLKLIGNNTDILIIVLILIVALVLFIRDFKLTSLRSWLLLFGLFAVGAIAIFKARRNKRLLDELEKREKALEAMEKRYEKKKKELDITESNYLQAKKQLDEQKKKTALDVARADEKYQEEVRKLEEKIATTSPEKMILEVRKLLNE